MSHHLNKKLFIQGVTHSGKKFRPSDWAERLCCSVSCFRPNYDINQHGYCSIYSEYAHPTTIDGIQFVIVDEKIGEIDPNALRFILNFAKDNDLPVLEACELPDLTNHNRKEN
jgi:hypothetical protein